MNRYFDGLQVVAGFAVFVQYCCLADDDHHYPFAAVILFYPWNYIDDLLDNYIRDLVLRFVPRVSIHHQM